MGARCAALGGPHALRVTGPLPVGINSDLRWAVLPNNVLLVHPDKPWGSHLENPLQVVIEEVIEMGAEAIVRLQAQGLPEARACRCACRSAPSIATGLRSAGK